MSTFHLEAYLAWETFLTTEFSRFGFMRSLAAYLVRTSSGPSGEQHIADGRS